MAHDDLIRNVAPRFWRVGPIIVLAAAVGCGDSTDGGDVTAKTDNPSAPAPIAVPSTPTSIASLALPNGNTVEFYNVGGFPLISELGAAYTAPAFESGVTKRRLPDIWRALAPSVPVPEALNKLQAIMDSPVPPPDAIPNPPAGMSYLRGEQPPSPQPNGSDLMAAPVGCNNGCCDYDWLSTFTECDGGIVCPDDGGGPDYTWFQYNDVWSTDHSTNINVVSAFVCAAENSTWSISVNGSGGTWSIPAAHYRRFLWQGCDFFWCGQSMTSSVNSPSATALHTHCGSVCYN
jgi:hypothetical protein